MKFEDCLYKEVKIKNKNIVGTLIDIYTIGKTNYYTVECETESAKEYADEAYGDDRFLQFTCTESEIEAMK